MGGAGDFPDVQVLAIPRIGSESNKATELKGNAEAGTKVNAVPSLVGRRIVPRRGRNRIDPRASLKWVKATELNAKASVEPPGQPLFGNIEYQLG
jgi:hypothetical protein